MFENTLRFRGVRVFFKPFQVSGKERDIPLGVLARCWGVTGMLLMTFFDVISK